MDRNHPEYLKRKHAWELSRSAAWTDWLKPLLESMAVSETAGPDIDGLDSAFKAARQQAVCQHVRHLLALVTRKAGEFSALQANPAAGCGISKGTG